MCSWLLLQSVDEKVVCCVVCGQHRSDDTSGVSGVFSEALAATERELPLQPC